MLTTRPPRPRLRHRAGDPLAHEEGSAEVHRHHLVPVGFSHVEGGADDAKTRVIDEDIDVTVRGDDAGDSFVDRGDVPHVQLLRVHHQAARPRFRDETNSVNVRAYSRHDDRSGLGEQNRQLAPDSLGRASDDDDVADEIEAPRRSGNFALSR
jgi:hypothetical protein